MFPEVFFTPVAQPDSQHLRNLFFFAFGKAIVELERALPFEATWAVSVSIPVGSGNANATGCLFDQSDTFEIVIMDLTLFCHRS